MKVTLIEEVTKVVKPTSVIIEISEDEAHQVEQDLDSLSDCVGIGLREEGFKALARLQKLLVAEIGQR